MDKIGKLVIYCVLGLLLLGKTSCTDEDVVRLNKQGEKVVLHDLTFSTSQIVTLDVPISRADSHSEVDDLTLFVFDESGAIEGVFEIPPLNIVEITSDSRERKYQINYTIELTTGTKHFYAIANVVSGYYWENVLDELKGLTREESFTQYLFSINERFAAQHTLPILTSQALWLSGYGEVEVSGTGDNGSASGTIYLKRPVAQIIFNVKNTYKDDDGNTHTFIPETYVVYNVPQQMPVIEMDNEVMGTENDMRQYYNTISFNFNAAGSDGVSREAFYLPENVQKDATESLTDYHQRDTWNNEYVDEAKTEKKWTYAPQKSTFIVISGQYTERDKNEVLVRQGNVDYTVHLGDFSNWQSSVNKLKDFKVERNCRYTYTLTVQGVDKIVAEAEVDGKEEQPGAEGDIIVNTPASEIFDLDCHYEQVFVQYDLTAIAEEIRSQMSEESAAESELDTYIGNSFILKAVTPFADADFVIPYARSLEGQEEETVTENMDYKWIYFLSQSENKSIAKYPGDGCKDQMANSFVYNNTQKELINPYELCVRLGKLVKQLLDGGINDYNDIVISNENGHQVARFTAFIDENYYQRNPINNSVVGWDTYTRQNDRSMLIASDIHISEDGFSTYAVARTSFTQRSIQTFYNADVVQDINALGMETYCENSLFSMASAPTSDTYNASAGRSSSNGRANMIGLTKLNNGNNRWDVFIKSPTNGYISADISHGHKIDEYSLTTEAGKKVLTYTSHTLQDEYFHPYFACLSRNRDLNGNGTIDDNEIRWYLPSGDQYLRLSIGSDAMSETSRLFEGDKTTIVNYSDYPSNFLEDGALYMTSTLVDPTSGTNKRVFWAGEVGAFGGYNGNYGFVRCVRNLPSKTIVEKNPDQEVVGDEALGTISYTLRQTSNGNYIFDFENRLDTRIYRVESQEGAYEHHFEEPIAENMSEANRLPQGFVVARRDVGTGDEWNFTPTLYGATKNNIWKVIGDQPCDNYSEDGAPYRGRWRVPNLREMMVMASQAGKLGFFNYDTGLYYYIISTDFSGRDDNNERQGFAFQAKNWNNNGNLVNTGFITVETSSNNIYVRCVRDMTDADK